MRSKDFFLAIVRIMAKVTSKLQVTIPKAIADAYGIKPGDEIEFEAAGQWIRVVPPGGRKRGMRSAEERLRIFDQMMAEQREREKRMKLPARAPKDRGWKREDLYLRDGKLRGEPD